MVRSPKGAGREAPRWNPASSRGSCRGFGFGLGLLGRFRGYGALRLNRVGSFGDGRCIAAGVALHWRIGGPKNVRMSPTGGLDHFAGILLAL